jgi:Rrf2 family protein
VELTRQADYALRCVLEVARHDRISAGAIAARQRADDLADEAGGELLARAGVLETHRGAAGGVQLGRPAAEITVLDVVEAVEGPVRVNRCVRTPPACSLVELCPLSPVFRDAQDALVAALSISLAELIARDEPHEALREPQPAPA